MNYVKDKAYIRKGLDKNVSLKKEKADAAHAAYELLVGKPQQTREYYRNKILDAKTSGQIGVILKEVRDII